MKTERQLIDISILSVVKFFLVVLGLYFLFIIKEILAILFVALIFASAVDPWVDKMEKIKFPRWLSILLIYIVLLLALFVIFYLLIPPMAMQFGQLIKHFPQYFDKLGLFFENAKTFSAEHGLLDNFSRSFDSLKNNIPNAAKSVFVTVSEIFGGIVSFFIILVIAFYMTVEESALKRTITYFLPNRYQAFTMDLINKVQLKIGAWLKGQLILCLIIGLLVYVGLLILGVNYALILALLAAFGEFIPYVGPAISAVPAIFLAFTQSPIKALFVLILFIVAQQLENHVLVPKVMQKAVGLNPIISIIALLVGAKVGGVVGMILAIPVATALSVILREIWSSRENIEEAKKEV